MTFLSRSTQPSDVRVCRSLVLLPIITFLFVPGCFTITYLIAVTKDHVHPVLPMISETGEELPENFVFATVVNVGSFCGSLNFMARYFVLSSWMHTKPLMGPLRMAKFSSLNRISLVIALLAVMGALIVGNVEANRHLYLHNLGACIVVLMQLMYCWIHSYLTYAHPMSRMTIYLRTTLATCMTLAFLMGATSVPFAHSVPELTVDERDNSTIVQTARYIGYRWVSDEHRYFPALLFYHFTEWFIVFCCGIFLLSFAVEFRRVHIQIPQLFFYNSTSLICHRRSGVEQVDGAGPLTPGQMRLMHEEAAMSSQNEIFSTPERSLSMASIEFIPNHADENHHNKNIELQEV